MSIIRIGADVALINDFSAIVAVTSSDDGIYRVAGHLEIAPARGKPLVPSEVFAAFTNFAAPFRRLGWDGLFIADGHYKESLREFVRPLGIGLRETPDKNESFLVARRLLNEGLAKVPRAVAKQLERHTVQANSGGRLTISAPRSATGGHCDLASAWVLALSAAAEAGQSQAYYTGNRSDREREEDARWTGSGRDCPDFDSWSHGARIADVDRWGGMGGRGY